MVRIAVIDCGTNTFNLGIADVTERNFTYIYNDRIPVKLGSGGIHHQLISPEAFERGVNALIEHKKTIEKFGADVILAIGTAALRDAKNGTEFVSRVNASTGIHIQLIDGLKEAELIWLAAKTRVPIEGKFLVMDIGGGSNEFIIADQEKIYWKNSYRLGVSRLKEEFRFDEIEKQHQFIQLENHLIQNMSDLHEQCRKQNVHTMIGSAGSFDSYANLITLNKTGKNLNLTDLIFEFNTTELLQTCEDLIHLPNKDLAGLKGVPDFRKEFMVYSSFLIKTVIEKCGIQKCHLSTWSLKEGMILDAISNPK